MNLRPTSGIPRQAPAPLDPLFLGGILDGVRVVIGPDPGNGLSGRNPGEDRPAGEGGLGPAQTPILDRLGL